MTKTTLVILALAVFAAGRLSYLSHGDAHPPPPATTHDTRTAISQNDSNYLCGVFGEWIYKFPKSIFGSWAQYVGDDPWSGKLSNPHRGCNDRFTNVLVKMCVPDLKLTEFNRADPRSCFVSLLVASAFNENYLDKRLQDYRRYQLAQVKDGYDELLGLYYFDAYSIGVERIFWNRDPGGGVTVIGGCSVHVPVPWCRFVTHSESVGASVQVSFAMEHIRGWNSFVLAAEQNLNAYKYKIIRGVNK